MESDNRDNQLSKK